MSLKKYVNRRKAARGLPKYRRVLDPYDPESVPSVVLLDLNEYLMDREAAWHEACATVRREGVGRRP